MKKTFTFLLTAACIIAGYLLFFSSFDLFNNTHHKDVVIIDKSLENYQDLVHSSAKDALVILAENTDSGFLALQDKISSLRGVRRLHILTHGTRGNLVLGRQQLNEQNLEKFNGFWKAISNSLESEKSELLIYSCQLAAGEAGKSFVNKLHDLLGISVAGSVDNTGSGQKGGNWDLEYVAGRIIKDHVLKYIHFKGLLIPKFSELSGSASPFDAMKIFTDDQLIYGDFDADGDIDIHLYPFSGASENQFWRNNGSGGFSQVTGSANPFDGITEKAVFHSAKYAFVADWDNDGDDDIFVTKRSSSGQNIFYKNNNGVYQEISGSSSPFYSIHISGDDQLIYGDFDSDGDIDIHSYQTGAADNDFWQNNGSGQFTKVTGAGNPFRNLSNAAAFYTSAQFAWVADWDNDGDSDIFVTKRSIGAAVTGENILYRNNGGTFVEVAGNASPFKNIAIVQDNQFIYGDFDADGDIDIQASSSNSVTTLKFWQNNGSGSFSDVTGANNPFNDIPNNGTFYSTSTKAFVADWDNDKDVDVFVTYRTATDQNILFVQSDAPPLLSSSVPVSAATGVSTDANITLTFNRAVTAVSGKNIVIKRVSNNSTFATIPVTDAQVSGSSTATITVNLATDFQETTGYYVLIDKGAFKDIDSRIFAGITSSTKLVFTTRTAPAAPTLTTAGVTVFNTNSATLGGNVSSDGGSTVSDRGIVWNTSTTPTILNNKIGIGSGTGNFSQSVGSLPSGTRIFVRAYATNQIGTAYGNEVDFYTKTTVSSITKVGSSPTNAGSVAYTVNFANSITGLDATDFTVTTSGVTGAAITDITGSGTTYTITIGTGTGNGTIRLDFTGISGTQPAVNASYTSANAYDIYKNSTASNYFRTKNISADWNQTASWESSPDNSFWIAATSFPNSNTAAVSILAGQTINLPTGFNATTGNLNSAGTINTNASTLTVSGTLSNTGTIKGSGTIATYSFTNNASIAPGNSAGLLSFSGNVINNGTINIEIGGTAAGSGYDKILISGALSISGILNVSLINGYTPVLGDEFTIIDAASSSGTFSTVNLPSVSPRIWETAYSNANGTVILRVINDPLPVTLVNFEVLKKEAVSELSWTTSLETNSSHFEIERSTKGLDWELIGSVTAISESKSLKKYGYKDTRPLSGENLYRLKMVDLDGTFAYSRIRSVLFDQPVIKISPYPNPVTEKLFLDVKNPGTISHLSIYNFSGTVVSKPDRYTADGIQVGQLPAGMYILNFINPEGQRVNYKFVKN
ncbi:DUF4347 domain-containing protein [Dyadobacter subterraneus]|uniref:DUF4347 domain-containing protein n=1 Tax=Dyadobacter subterraneus TaxID=2773304 RepID=A0ABR9W889_9BACT|nr:DUF4347 domain-containing protein [Dyadobacter subterraneus]MBE9461683.1 DUF4347 domain-containing protein [Dyadobacter subterraneus]